MKRTHNVLLILAVLQAASVVAQDRMPMIPADKQTNAQKKAVADYRTFAKLISPGRHGRFFCGYRTWLCHRCRCASTI
jgi:hypothetical protein